MVPICLMVTPSKTNAHTFQCLMWCSKVELQNLKVKKPKEVHQELINELVDPNMALVTHPRSREHVKAVQRRDSRGLTTF